MERQVDFVTCDMPSANAFMINLYGVVAQEERRMISDRTRACGGRGRPWSAKTVIRARERLA
jgi:hypothetical protein